MVKNIKAPAKKAAAKKAPIKKAAAKKEPTAEKTYAMPQEVRDWIERADSRIKYLQGQIDRLKAENEDLKSYRRFAEQRILRSEHE